MWSVAFFVLVTFNVVVGQETQEELDYKEKHFCEDDETIKALEGSDGSVVETKRCGIDKQGKATCIYCNKCTSAYQREGTNCKAGSETQEELDYKEKHFCEDDETIKSLQNPDGNGVTETKRCGFDTHGKATCVYCNKCAAGYEHDGAACRNGDASLSGGSGPVMFVVACAILLALVAGIFFVCTSQRRMRSASGTVGTMEKPSLRREKMASRRTLGGRSRN